MNLKDEVGDVEAALDLKGIPDDVAEYARVRLGETPEKRMEALEDLRELIYRKWSSSLRRTSESRWTPL